MLGEMENEIIRFSTAREIWTNVVWVFCLVGFYTCFLTRNNCPDSIKVVDTVPHEAI